MAYVQASRQHFVFRDENYLHGRCRKICYVIALKLLFFLDSLEEMPRGPGLGRLLCCLRGYQPPGLWRSRPWSSPASSRRSVETQVTTDSSTLSMPDEEELNIKFAELVVCF